MLYGIVIVKIYLSHVAVALTLTFDPYESTTLSDVYSEYNFKYRTKVDQSWYA